jgi:nucleotidyltransferase/DNA polymerase involved in DNA repair
MHDLAEFVVIVDGVGLDTTIVPEGEGARLPAETAGELGTDLMREQVIEKRLQRVKERIKDETGLVASVGVAASKFLAKLASDQGKPDGFVILRPE